MGSSSFLLVGIALSLFGGMLGCFELGYRFARRTSKTEPQGGTDIMDAAVFSLLGLLLAFEFAGAANRLQNRRQISLAEVNAISTAYTRIDLLEEDDQTKLRELFRNYVDAKLRAREAMPDLVLARKEYDQAEDLFSEIWTTATAACREDTTKRGVTQVVIPALNDMSDRSVDGGFAATTHSPVMLQVFTFIVALIGAVLVGVRAYAKQSRPWLHLFVFATVISFTYFMILDLEYPRVGFVRLGSVDEAFLDIRQSME